MRCTLLLLLLCGCEGSTTIWLPTPTTEMQTIIAHFPARSVEQTVHVGATSELGDIWTFESTEETDEVRILLHPSSLESLQLTTGAMKVSRIEDRRRLPSAGARAYVGTADNASLSEVVDVDLFFSELLFPELDLLRCAKGGGCLGERDDQICTLPCLFDETIEPPESPQPPELTPCPAGWTQQRIGSVDVCDPSPRNTNCGAGEALFVGETTCRTVGDPCPTGRWPVVPRGAVYVADDAFGGDGTEANPFTLSEALSRAPATSTIALSKGTYDNIVLMRPLSLWGACASETRIAQFQARTDSALKNLTAGKILVDDGVSLAMTGVFIEKESNDNSVGLRLAPGATVHGTDVLIRNLDGHSVYGFEGAYLSLDQAVIEGGYGLSLNSTATLTDIAIRDTVEDYVGIILTHGHLILERALLEDHDEHAIVLQNRDTTATLKDVVLRNNGRVALTVKDEAVAQLSRGFFSDNGESSIRLHEATLSIEDVAMLSSDHESASSLTVHNGSVPSLKRVHLEDNGSALNLGTSIPLLEDLVVRNNRENLVDLAYKGEGLEGYISRVAISCEPASNPGCSTTLKLNGGAQVSDVSIDGPDRSIVISDSADIKGQRIAIRNPTRNGITLERFSIVNFSDLSISGSHTIEGCMLRNCAGSGIFLLGAATIALNHFRIHDCEQSGFIMDAGIDGITSATLIDGTFSKAPIGVAPPGPDFDRRSIATRVLYQEDVQVPWSQ